MMENSRLKKKAKFTYYLFEISIMEALIGSSLTPERFLFWAKPR